MDTNDTMLLNRHIKTWSMKKRYEVINMHLLTVSAHRSTLDWFVDWWTGRRVHLVFKAFML